MRSVQMKYDGNLILIESAGDLSSFVQPYGLEALGYGYGRFAGSLRVKVVDHDLG